MDLNTIVVVALSIGAGSIVKGATGVGLPLIAVPFMASWLGIHQAIAIMLVPVLVSNLWQIGQFRRLRQDPRMGFLLPMLVAGTVGLLFGTLLLKTLPERALFFMLGMVLLAYLAVRLAKPNFVLTPSVARSAALPVGLGSGLLHGAAGVSAPLSVPFIHAMRLERPAHIYAVSAIFLVLSVIQWPSLYVAGIMRLEWVVLGVLALIPMLVFMPIGQWLASRLPPAAFDKLILSFLGIMGVKMVLGY